MNSGRIIKCGTDTKKCSSENRKFLGVGGRKHEDRRKNKARSFCGVSLGVHLSLLPAPCALPHTSANMATLNISKKRKFVADGVFYSELNEVSGGGISNLSCV